jgi:uncharacterized protein (DUF342 family)
MTPEEKENLTTVWEKDTECLHVVGKVTVDKLKFFVDCTRTPSEHPRQVMNQELINLLEGIPQKFLHFDVIADIVRDLNRDHETQNRRIAKGIAPTPGRDGKLIYLVKKYDPRHKPPELVDPRFVRAFDNIEAGMVLGRIYPPTSGIGGIDVFGQLIEPKPGAPKEIQLDNSAEIVEPKKEERFLSVVAKNCGYLQVQGDQLSVKDTLMINGDIDYRTGDVDFIGSVVIKNGVTKGFQVIARGNIQVNRDVQGGKLVSTEGSGDVKGSILGGPTAEVVVDPKISESLLSQLSRLRTRPDQIRAAGTIRAFSAENTSLSAIGNIEIAKEMMDSTIRTRGIFRIPQGHIVNGEVFSVGGVEAGIVGSDAGATTMLYLCSDVESSSGYSSLLRQIRAYESAEEMLRLYLGPYAENPSTVESLPKVQKQRMQKTLSKLGNIKQRKERLLEEKAKALSTAKYKPILRVNFEKMLYDGVNVIVGDNEFVVDENIEGPGTVEFIQATGEFVVGELKPMPAAIDDQTPTKPQSISEKEDGSRKSGPKIKSDEEE